MKREIKQTKNVMDKERINGRKMDKKGDEEEKGEGEEGEKQ